MSLSIIRLPTVIQQTGLKRSTIYKMICEDKFPKQIDLGGGRAVGWLESDVQNWIEQRLRASRLVSTGEAA